ncbi:MAG: T9SS type A sorting domain-containing protein [Bacteroidales bacterium]|nr:T9SS type A sorting domain-containing protein [Bacteroidales bacterium]
MKTHLIFFSFLFAIGIVKAQSSYVNVSLALPDPCTTTDIHESDSPKTEESMTLVVRPNPSNGNFFCMLCNNEPLNEVTVAVIDMTGVVLYQDKWYSETEKMQTQMSLNNLPNGIYLLSVNTKKNRASAKIIIEK